ncbi:MAG: hypothetical protein COW65_13690 [Cytophagales bacterium CG18_big_fil_WC_8_21_14_2_50_42_9]|nr:MAG: hypothetical protein COW65_13690 [Cytophagales bacterium CG18_big_fil_WC_8_21_14_2_50_42_9]
MKQQVPALLDFEVDKLTNSIENAITGEIFNTEITKITAKQSRQIKKADWLLDWHLELKDQNRDIHKLTTLYNPTIIHGLISLSDNHDHIFMNLIESAKFNKGEKKLYKGVAGNLIAFACKTAFEKNYDGIVAFVAKTQLIEHYKQTLGAKTFAGNRMFIDTKESLSLVKQYFKDFSYGK